jgi:integrase
MSKLTALAVSKAKPGRHADGRGLYLLVKPTGARSWLLRVQVDGRRRDIGLGAFPDVSLSDARETSAGLRKAAKAGRDPVQERDREKREAVTFRQATIAAHAAYLPGWSEKTAAAFLSTMEEHAYPVLGSMRVDHIDTNDVAAALLPIWSTIPLQAAKVRHRISTVLNYSKAKGWRANEAPTKSLSTLLHKQATGGNMPAMPYAELPDYVADLQTKTETIGRLALLFLIHTAARSGEVRKARWDQIDLEARTWVRPASIMKSGVAHTVTLSREAVAVLRRALPYRGKDDDALVFPSKSGAILSDMTISKILRDAKLPYVPHGFRSSFRDWAAEQMAEVPDAVAEAALSHAVPDKVVRAYKRTTFLDMRRTLLDGWGRYVTGQTGDFVLTGEAA